MSAFAMQTGRPRSHPDVWDGASSLLVIPAADPASGPVATIRMPVRVPLGLHGNWLPPP